MDSTVVTFLSGASATVDYKEAQALDKFVTKMKLFGQWDFLDGFIPEYMTDLILSKTNVVNNLTATTNVISHIPKRGNAGDGITWSINTGSNLSTQTNFTQNSGILMTHLRDNISSGGIDIGAFDGTSNGAWIAGKWNTDNKSKARCNTATSLSSDSVINDCRGFNTVLRNGTTEQILLGKSIIKSSTTTSTSKVNNILFLGSVSATMYFSGRRRTFSLWASASLNLNLVIDLLQDLLVESGATIKTLYTLGDSVTQGNDASPITNGFSYLLGQDFDVINMGVGGQLVSQGYGGSVNFNTFPVFNPAYDYGLTNAWGLNDENQNVPVNIFRSDYTKAIFKQIENGFSKDKIFGIDGFFITNSAPYTPTNYKNNRVIPTRELYKELGIECLKIQDYMEVNGGASLVDADGVHPINSGHNVIYSGVKTIKK